MIKLACIAKETLIKQRNIQSTLGLVPFLVRHTPFLFRRSFSFPSLTCSLFNTSTDACRYRSVHSGTSSFTSLYRFSLLPSSDGFALFRSTRRFTLIYGRDLLIKAVSDKFGHGYLSLERQQRILTASFKTIESAAIIVILTSTCLFINSLSSNEREKIYFRPDPHSVSSSLRPGPVLSKRDFKLSVRDLYLMPSFAL